MQSRTFKEVFASVRPDRPASPALSRAERQAKVAPPIVPEALERRRLFSVLVVNGDSSANYIQLYQDPDTHDLLVFIDEDPAQAFSPSGVTSASVSGLGGNDTILIVGLGDPGAFPLPVWADGGDGNDSIVGGDYADTLYGGNGDDDMDGGDSADIVYGGVGYDIIQGGDGADLVYGGTGSGDNSDSVTGYDQIYGDDGNDSLFGEGGGDSIYGGEGADSIRGGDFDDFIKGEDGADTMYGDDGDDTIDAREPNTATDLLVGGNGNDCGWWDSGQESSDLEGKF